MKFTKRAPRLVFTALHQRYAEQASLVIEGHHVTGMCGAASSRCQCTDMTRGFALSRRVAQIGSAVGGLCKFAFLFFLPLVRFRFHFSVSDAIQAEQRVLSLTACNTRSILMTRK